MTPEQETKITALLERIAVAVERQAEINEETRISVRLFTQSFPAHIRDFQQAMMSRK